MTCTTLIIGGGIAGVPPSTVGPAARHRHILLTVTTRNRPGGFQGQRGDFRSRGAPTATR